MAPFSCGFTAVLTICWRSFGRGREPGHEIINVGEVSQASEGYVARKLVEGSIVVITFSNGLERCRQKVRVFQAGHVDLETFFGFSRELWNVVFIGHDYNFAVVANFFGDLEGWRWSLQQEVVEVAKQCLEGVGVIVVEYDLSLVCFLQPHV